jgi:hypothetical protein
MSATAAVAVVEPKGKFQNPGAKAKRLTGLRTNPDFVEAVLEERAASKMWEDRHADLHRKYKVMMDERLSCQREMIDNEELKNEYIDQLKENKKLVAEIQEYKGCVALSRKCVEHLEETIKYQSETIELNKKARTPNRVAGGKRGRPLGSKSKAVSFGADALPDNDLVPFGTRAEIAAALT